MKLHSQFNRIVVAAGLAFSCFGVFAAPIISLPVTDTSGKQTVDPSGAPAQANQSFQSSLKDDGTRKSDSFSSYAITADDPPPGTQSLLDMGATIGAQLSSIGGGGRIVDKNADAGNGRFDTTGDYQDPTSPTGTPTGGRWWLTAYSFSLAFTPGTVSAFGFYGTDFGDFEGSFEIELYRGASRIANQVIPTGNGSSGSSPMNGNSNGWLQFYSIYDDEDVTFDRVVFKITQKNPLGDPSQFDYLGFDDFVVGRYQTSGGGTVPEPGSLALVGASLLGLAALRRRKPRA